MFTRVPVEVAAEVLHKSATFIRWALQNQRVDFGFAAKTGKDRWSYCISSKMFSDYTGVPEEKLEEMSIKHRQKYQGIMAERRKEA